METRFDTAFKTIAFFCLAIATVWCAALLPETAWGASDESSLGALPAKAVLVIDVDEPSDTPNATNTPPTTASEAKGSSGKETTSAEASDADSDAGNDAGNVAESRPERAAESDVESRPERAAESDSDNAGANPESTAESNDKSAPETPPEMTADIMGDGIIPADAMVALYQQSGYPYPADVYASMGAPTIEDFVDLCIEEASAEGVRPEVLFAQIMHETGWLQFGGQVNPEQNNFGGLGATNDGAAGASFPDVRTGLRAQVQHLKAYASTEELRDSVVDPRFDLVSRGCAPTVYDLGGRWAYPGDYYGEALMNRMKDMYAIAYQ